MAFLFGGARQPENLKDFQRQVSSSARGSGREVEKLMGQEKAMLGEIKKRGKLNDLIGAQQKAKELIRLRAHKSRLVSMQTNLTGLSQELGQVHTSQKTAELMGKTTRMLQLLNTGLDVRGVYSMLREFEKQNVLMKEKQEVLNETLDSAFEADDEQEASDNALEQVMQEVGLDIRMGAVAVDRPVAESDLEGRLERLRVGLR